RCDRRRLTELRCARRWADHLQLLIRCENDVGRWERTASLAKTSSAARFRKRAALPHSLLTEARRRDLHVRMLPDFIEAGPGLGAPNFFALGLGAGRQSRERPAIVRPAAEILAIHRLRLGMLTIVEQEDAKRVPYRHDPVRRFAVTQLVFLRDRRPQRLDPRL